VPIVRRGLAHGRGSGLDEAEEGVMKRSSLVLLMAGVAAMSGACSSSNSNSKSQPVDIPFDAANFDPSQMINNRYWPLVPGTSFVFTSRSEDGCEVELFEVTNELKNDFPAPYDAIVAQEIHDRSWLSTACDDNYALIETTRDWYAQDRSANIWYFGEDTESYDQATCPSTAGSWAAGVGGAEAGIIMLGEPTPRASYKQEFSSGNAEDMAEVLRLDAAIDGGFGAFSNCLETKETTPLEPKAVEHKFYCPDGGGLLLIEESQGNTKQRTEYTGSTLPAGNYAESGSC
jgi:hypothetical protein